MRFRDLSRERETDSRAARLRRALPLPRRSAPEGLVPGGLLEAPRAAARDEGRLRASAVATVSASP